MAAVEEAPGAAASADFSFAFNNAQFSDCTIRLVIADSRRSRISRASFGSPQAPYGSNVQASPAPSPGPAKVIELHLSTAILAARSSYFRGMFSGRFRESDRKNAIEVLLSPEEEAPFLDLIHLMYSGSLPPETAGDLSKILAVLVPCDRFGCEECLPACERALRPILGQLDPKDASLILSIPEHQRQMGILKPAINKAIEAVRTAYGPLLLEEPRGEAFYSIPESAMAALLETPVLPSEDSLLDAALDWLNHKHPEDQEDRLVALGSTVWASIRPFRLSREKLDHLCSFTFDLLAATGAMPFQAPSASASEVQVLGERVDNTLVLNNRPKAAPADPLTQCMRVVGLLGIANLLPVSSLDPNKPTAQPAKAIGSPSGIVVLDLPLVACSSWYLGRQRPKALSGKTFIQGSWFVFEATLERDSTSTPIMSLYLTADKLNFAARAAGFRARCRFGYKSGSSSADYTWLSAQISYDFKKGYKASLGLRDAFQLPFATLVQQAATYFPDGAMQLRAEIWTGST